MLFFFFKSLSKKNFERRNKMEEGLFSINFFSIYERHLHQQIGFFFLSNWNQSGGIGSKLILSRWLRGEIWSQFYISPIICFCCTYTFFFTYFICHGVSIILRNKKVCYVHSSCICKGVFHRDFHPQTAQKSWTSQNNWFQQYRTKKKNLVYIYKGQSE